MDDAFFMENKSKLKKKSVTNTKESNEEIQKESNEEIQKEPKEEIQKESNEEVSTNNDSSNQTRKMMILKHSTKETEPQLNDSLNSYYPSQIKLLPSQTSQSLTQNNQIICQKSLDQSNLQNFIVKDFKDKLPDVFNLIDSETKFFQENLISKYLNMDTVTGPLQYSKIGVVGKQGVGKSSLLNKIAGKKVFTTHFEKNNDILLKHVTEGMQLHITDERLFLLDSQPLLSASILDDIIKNSNLSGNAQEGFDPEKQVLINSLQILSFLIVTCDYLIVVNDWLLDIHFLKLILTAFMLVGNSTPKADLVFYYKNKVSYNQLHSTIQLLFGKSVIICEEDEDKFVISLFKLCAKKKLMLSTLGNCNISEKKWLSNAKIFWENCTKKSSVYNEYSKFLFKSN